MALRWLGGYTSGVMHFLKVGRGGWFLLVCALTALPALGCDDGSSGSSDSGLPDGSTTPTAVIEVVGDSNLALLFGDEASVRILYREMDGSPIAGEPVELALVGRANDASLSELSVQTDVNGEAGFRVMAGTTASAFSVRVTAPRAAPILIGVSVSDAGFGGLVVNVEWMGSRRVETRRVGVFTGMTCDDEDVLAGEADREKTLVADETQAQFLALPAGLVYAVTASGLGPMGDVVAQGCTDSVAIEADVDTEITVTMSDLPLEAMGTYATLLDVDAAAAAQALSRAVTRGGRSLVEGGGGDATFFLDRLEQHLRDGGDTMAADSVASERVSAFLDDGLSASLTTDMSGPTRAVDALSEELRARAARLAIDGRVTLHATDPSFEVVSVSTGDATSSMPSLVVDLTALGTVGGRLAYTPMPEADAISIDEIGATIPLGSLGVALDDALVVEAGADDVASLLEARGGCGTLVSWAGTEPVIDAACDATCVGVVCQDALMDIADAIETELRTLDLSRTDITLSGVVDARDEGGDLSVDAFSSDAMDGRYESPDGSDYDDVVATVSGARVIE